MEKERILTLIELFLKLASSVFQKNTRICRKCKAMPGEGFCDRSMLGEPGACVFDRVDNCKKCSSAVPCFGHPCELSDRLSELRKDWKPRV
jgi:hypothetical protein